MPRQWETKEVTAHGAGITDDIKNAPPVFQAECNNIVYDFKTHNLSNRRGSQILRDVAGTDFNQDLIAALVGYRIEQIFQLENQLLISAWSDQLYAGKVITYDEKTREVTLTRPPDSRKGLDIYGINYPDGPTSFRIRVVNSNGMGIEGDLISSGLDLDNTNHIDHLLFFIHAGASVVRNVQNYYQRRNGCLFDIEYQFLQPDNSIFGVPWQDIKDDLNSAGHTVDFVEGTVPTQDIFLDGDLALSNEHSPVQWGSENPDFEDDLYRSSITSLGHLQSAVYIGESFIATEPYDKSFQVNTADKDMLDPENFPPLTLRATIKRIANYWDGQEATSQIRDAQLPTTYLSLLELPELSAGGPAPAEYKYMKVQRRFAPNPNDGTVGHNIDIWFDRVSGYTDTAGNIAMEFHLVGGEGTTIPEGDWAILDYVEIQANVLDTFASLGAQINSGQLALAYNQQNSPDDIGQSIIDKISQAFLDYLARDNIQYPTMGFAVLPSGVFDTSRLYSVSSNLSGSIFYNSTVPVAAAKYLYNYGFYLRESYTKTDDGVPKIVENNGPAAFLQVPTLSEISSTSNSVGFWASNDQGTNPPTSTVEISLSPNLIGSVSRRFTRVDKEWFDFNDIKGVFARTQNTGTVFYDVAESNWFVPNDLAIQDKNAEFDPDNWDGSAYGYFVELIDKNYDRDIISFELAYFNGGVLSYAGLAQGSKYLDIINGTAYYGNVIDNEARVFQSSPGIPSSSPRLLFSDFEDPMTGVNSFLEKPIVFTENKTWRIEGVKDATGVGRVFLRVVSDEFGCIANQSVVKTNIGLFYWSKVGIIYTDGLKAMRVSEHLLARFQTWKGAVMPNGLDIGPVGLRGAYDEVSKQIIYSGYTPDSVIVADEIFVAPQVSENYKFPKGLAFPQVTHLTFTEDLTSQRTTVITLDGQAGPETTWQGDNPSTMLAIADSIAEDFPQFATGVLVTDNIIEVTYTSSVYRFLTTAQVQQQGGDIDIVTSAIIEQFNWQLTTGFSDFDLALEITVRDDGDAFYNEMLTYNGVAEKVIKLVDGDHVVWTFTTNVHSTQTTVVTRIVKVGFYIVRIKLIEEAAGNELWSSIVTVNGVIITDRDTLISSFGEYSSGDFSKWEAYNNPGSFANVDPEQFTWYSLRYGILDLAVVSAGGGDEILMTFRSYDDADFSNFFTELETFLTTEGIFKIIDVSGVPWTLTSVGVTSLNVSKATDTITLILRTVGSFNNVTVIKDDSPSTIDALLSDFDDWVAVAANEYLWTQYNANGPIKTEYGGVVYPLPDTYGVPRWILCDVYYGVSKSMPFYTADGPALLQQSRRFKRDTFQTRVIWFSEDTLSVYRGQIGYSEDDEALVTGSAILAHKPILTNDEVYRTIEGPFYSPVDPFYKSVALSHGTKGQRKWTSRVMINFVDLNQTGVSIQPLGWNDLNRNSHKLAQCINYQHFTADDFSPPSDPDFPPTIIQYFRNTDASFMGEHLVSYRRRFPKGRIRNVYKQFGFEQLVQEYTTLSSDLAEINDVSITKLDGVPFSPISVRVNLLSPLNTYVRPNGASYVMFSWSDKWYKIVEVPNDNINGGDVSYLEFIALTSSDQLNTAGIVLIDQTVIIGRSPLDQAIQLSDWTVTFTTLGDRTQGLPKATELGGHN